QEGWEGREGGRQEGAGQARAGGDGAPGRQDDDRHRVRGAAPPGRRDEGGRATGAPVPRGLAGRAAGGRRVAGVADRTRASASRRRSDGDRVGRAGGRGGAPGGGRGG